MKTFVTVPITVASPRPIRQPRMVYYKIDARRSLLRRFQHFIESTDWEGRYLCHKWIDKICLGIVVGSLLYFAPLLGDVIFK